MPLYSSQQHAAVASAASGAVSGALVSVALQPFDVLRTRMQSDATRGMPRPLIKTMHAIAGDIGARNFWKGSSATVIRVGCGAGVHFYALQLMREVMEDRKSSRTERPLETAAENAMIGGTSRACAVTLLCPISLVKTRMEASGAAAAAFVYSSVPHAITSIVQMEGCLALWRGLLPALLANVPFSAIHYLLYTQLQGVLQCRMGEGTATTFACGASASVLATLLTQPFDVFRTRAMLGLQARIRKVRVVKYICRKTDLGRSFDANVDMSCACR